MELLPLILKILPSMRVNNSNPRGVELIPVFFCPEFTLTISDDVLVDMPNTQKSRDFRPDTSMGRQESLLAVADIYEWIRNIKLQKYVAVLLNSPNVVLSLLLC